MYNSRRSVVLLCLWLLVFSSESLQKKSCSISLNIPQHLQQENLNTLNTGNNNINNRSLSAWTWIPHMSSERIPAVIFEAECVSQYCTDPGNHPATELNSVPVYQQVLVLQQDPHDRKCFTAAYQRVAVGCTCVWAQSS